MIRVIFFTSIIVSGTFTVTDKAITCNILEKTELSFCLYPAVLRIENINAGNCQQSDMEISSVEKIVDDKVTKHYTVKYDPNVCTGIEKNMSDLESFASDLIFAFDIVSEEVKLGSDTIEAACQFHNQFDLEVDLGNIVKAVQNVDTHQVHNNTDYAALGGLNYGLKVFSDPELRNQISDETPLKAGDKVYAEIYSISKIPVDINWAVEKCEFLQEACGDDVCTVENQLSLFEYGKNNCGNDYPVEYNISFQNERDRSWMTSFKLFLFSTSASVQQYKIKCSIKSCMKTCETSECNEIAQQCLKGSDPSQYASWCDKTDDCSCGNGIAAKICDKNQREKCTSCDCGYTLDNFFCSPNETDHDH